MSEASDSRPGGHVPVLLHPVMEAVSPVDGAWIVDGTYGGGGYARAALAIADCRIIAVDRDPDAMARAWAHAGVDDRLKPAAGRFSEMDAIVAALGGAPSDHLVDGVMLDLGVSSFQIDQGERGFSFMREGPLDMRMEKRGPSAADAVNRMSEAELTEVFRQLGEEPAARRYAKAIVRQRAQVPFTTTLELARCIEDAAGGRMGRRTHPATRVFQALRMFVNDELGELARALVAAERVLRAGGRLAVVTFHSLEDRMVKAFLRERSGDVPGVSRHQPERHAGAAPTFDVPQRKAIEPSDEETAANPRSRSARLRWAIRTAVAARPNVPPIPSGLPRLAQLEVDA
ncbi:MAG: 16S rRNA (cytosine(1402)-N(4))-methyltransferase RsmH [Hyphomonadaceae bacterium]